MRGDQADDALGLGAADALAGVLAADRGPLDPQPAVGVDHHLDHGRVGERRGDGRPEGGAQHLPAAALRLVGGGEREEISHGASPSSPGGRCVGVSAGVSPLVLRLTTVGRWALWRHSP